jgi:hypothetical protein
VRSFALWLSGSFIAAASLIGCGDRVIYRALDVEIDGLSAQAQTLVLKVFPASDNLHCTNIALSDVQMLMAPVSATWHRSAGTDHTLTVPGVKDPGATVVVYTEDSMGQAIQYACASVTYEMIEERTIMVMLSAKMTM